MRVLTVSDKTDVKTTWYAGRTLLRKASRGRREGLRIPAGDDARQDASSWTECGPYVGSMNFDNRSIAFNNESRSGGARSAESGQQMDSIFLEDLKYSKEIKLDEFRKRPSAGKILEWGAQKLRRVL